MYVISVFRYKYIYIHMCIYIICISIIFLLLGVSFILLCSQARVHPSHLNLENQHIHMHRDSVIYACSVPVYMPKKHVCTHMHKYIHACIPTYMPTQDYSKDTYIRMYCSSRQCLLTYTRASTWRRCRRLGTEALIG